MNRRGPMSGGGRFGAPPTEKMDKKTRRGVVLRLGKYIVKEWPLFLLAVLFTLLSNQLALMGPEYSGEAIDAIVAEGGVQFDAVWHNILYMVVC